MGSEVCFETRVPTRREHRKDAVLIYKGAKVLLESSTPSEWVLAIAPVKPPPLQSGTSRRRS
jgi:hypothetical protein